MSKEVDLNSLNKDRSLFDSVYGWMYENNPFPYSVRYWFDHRDIFHPIRIYRKLSNIVRWIPILWQDVDWDYSSLYSVIHAKIKFMRQAHEKDHHHVDWEAVVAQMQTAEDCLSRLIDENYAMSLWDEHHKKFPRRREWIDLPDGNKQMVAMSDEQHLDFIKVCNEEDALRQSDLDTFASTFVKYVRHWWD